MIMPMPMGGGCSGGGYRRRTVYKKRKLSKYDAKILKSAKAERKKWPRKTYGTVHKLRGQPHNIADYGATWALADEHQRAKRQNDGYYGRGVYRGRGSYWGEQLGNWAGSALGGAIGTLAGPEGTAIGAGIGSRIGGYLGDLGSSAADKLLQSNQLINPNGSSMSLSVTSAENEVIVTKKEYLGDLVGTGDQFDTPYLLNLNPGSEVAFPYLSQLANYFDEYEFYQLIFEVKSLVTEGNATAAGSVVMATQYNANNPEFTSKNAMEQYDFSNSFKVTQSGVHGVECDPGKNAGSASRYVRTGPIQTNQDIKTYDLGVTQISLCNVPANLAVGELWVSYTCKLKKHKINLPGQDVSPNSALAVYSGGGTVTNTTIENTPFAGLQLADGSTPQFVPTIGSDGTIYFPSYILGGTYLLTYAIQSTTAALAIGTFASQEPTGLINCTLSPKSAIGTFYPNNNAGSTFGADGVACSTVIQIDCPNPRAQASLTWKPFSDMNLSGGSYNLNRALAIIQIPPAVVF